MLRYHADGINFSFADCCEPIPGDDVLGYIRNDGTTVEVHDLDCPRAAVIKSAFGLPIVSCRWEHHGNRHSTPAIHSEGVDRQGILHELISLISTSVAQPCATWKSTPTARCFDLTVLVNDVGDVDSLCSKIHKIPGVQRAARITDVN